MNLFFQEKGEGGRVLVAGKLENAFIYSKHKGFTRFCRAYANGQVFAWNHFFRCAQGKAHVTAGHVGVKGSNGMACRGHVNFLGIHVAQHMHQ